MIAGGRQAKVVSTWRKTYKRIFWKWRDNGLRKRLYKFVDIMPVCNKKMGAYEIN